MAFPAAPPPRRPRGTCRRIWAATSPRERSLAAQLSFSAVVLLGCVGRVVVAAVAEAQACPQPPACAERPETQVRAWVPLHGAGSDVMWACRGGEASWSTTCGLGCGAEAGGVEYHAAHFADDASGWIVGENGALARTTDGGATWSSLGVHGGTFWGVHFTSPFEGWVVGSRSRLGRTTDSGEHWTWHRDLFDTAANALHGVYFHSSQLGWVVGSEGRTYATRDGGSSWTIETWTTGQKYYAVHFANQLSGLVVGAGGVILWSDDGGSTWDQRRASGSGADLRAAHCIDDQVAFTVGEAGTLLRTVDAGHTWNTRGAGLTTASMRLLGIRFAAGEASKFGWIVGRDGSVGPDTAGVLLTSDNTGQTWIQAQVATGHEMSAISVVTVEVPLCPQPETTTPSFTTTINQQAAAIHQAQFEVLLNVLTSEEPRVTAIVGATEIVAERVAANPAGGSMQVLSASGVRAATVPASLLQSLGADGGAAMVFVEFGEGETPSWDPRPEAQEAMASFNSSMDGTPVIVRIAHRGAFADFQGLEEPIRIIVSPTWREGHTCAFWNETSMRWSSVGVKEVEGADGLVCETTHLSVFASVMSSILEGIEAAFLCTYADVLTAHGMANLADGISCGDRCLWTDSAWLIFWLFLVFQTSVIAWALYYDMAWHREELWSEACFLTDNPCFAKKNGKTWYKPLLTAMDVVTDLWQRPTSRVEYISLHASTVCIRNAVAGKLYVTVPELRLLLDWARKTLLHEQEQENEDSKASQQGEPHRNSLMNKFAKRSRTTCIEISSKQAKLLAYMPNIHECMAHETKRFHSIGKNRGELFTLVRYIFVSNNPWVKMGFYSILMPASEQSLLLTVRILSAFLAAAIFFQSDNAASVDSPCEPREDVIVTITKAVVVGIGSSVLGSLPVVVLTLLHSRGFIYKEEWTEVDKAKQLKNWKKQRIALWVLGVSMVLFCAIFCSAFLANVKRQDQVKWMTSGIITLIKLSLLTPVIIALVYTALGAATGFALMRDEVLKKARLQLRLDVDRDGVGDAESPANAQGSEPPSRGWSGAGAGAGAGPRVEPAWALPGPPRAGPLVLYGAPSQGRLAEAAGGSAWAPPPAPRLGAAAGLAPHAAGVAGPS